METLLPPTAVAGTWAEQFTAALRAKRDRSRQLLAAHQSRLEQAAAFVEQHILRLQEECKAERDQTELLRVARDALSGRLAQAESQLAEAENRSMSQAASDEHRAPAEESQRRLTSALEELRQARNRNNELQQQLAKSRATATKLAQEAQKPGTLDWEAEKRRIMAALEAESDQDDEAQKTERLGILEVLRTTDEVIATKDREIRALKHSLEEANRRGAETATEAESMEQTINQDTAIREERERLEKLQQEWRDKLRQAEVELAVERAKIARQRADLESQLFTSEQAPQGNGAREPDDPADRSSRRRWMARLGLTPADIEPSRHVD